MALSLESCPLHAQDIVWQQVDDEAVLMLPERAEVKVLNEVGARIWALIDGHRTVGAIAALIRAEYEVTPDAAQQDTLAFIHDLLQRQMLSLLPHQAAQQQ